MKYYALIGIGASAVLTAAAFFVLNRFGIDPFSRLIRESGAGGLDQLVKRGRHRLESEFGKQKVAYPPASVTLLYFKDEAKLLLYAGSTPTTLKLVRTYPVLAASGTRGPKLREGDLQVPEGIYAIESLNPRSRFHLSLRVNYPNAFDRAQAKRDARAQLGGDIMIHGGAASIGCIAIGDRAIEEIFSLAKETNFRSWKILLSPTDFRKILDPTALAEQAWVKDLYRQISAELGKL